MAKQQPEVAVLLELKDATASPMGTFTCDSGELLWGQMHTVIAGESSDERDTAAPGASFGYRAAARRGVWKVEAAYLENAWHVGFVCHHAGGDVDAGEVLRRAAEAGLGGSGRFGDLDIVFVDRYDWSGSSSFGSELIVQAVQGKAVDPDEDDFEDEKYYRSLVMGRFMLVDALALPSLLRALKEGARLEKRNYVMMRAQDGVEQTFGTHLVVANSEYDMAWMAFRNGELVGFVYDGAYSALEGSNLRIGKDLVSPPPAITVDQTP